MRKIVLFSTLLIFTSFVFLSTIAVSEESFTPEELIESVGDRRISMDFQNADFKDILKIFSQQAGLNFIASQQIQDRTVTLYLEDVSVEDALDKLLAANRLAYDLHNNIFTVKEWGVPDIETITKVIPLKYARVSNSPLSKEISEKLETGTVGTIEDAIRQILTSNGKVIEDPRTNSFVVTDIPSHLPLIEQTIKELDIPTPQILVEVEMLDVNANTAEQLGMNWPEALAKLDVTGKRNTNFPFTGDLGNDQDWTWSELTSPGGVDFSGLGAGKFAPSVLTIIGHELALYFFKSQADTKYLARPRVLTLANETAEIKITAQEAIGSTQEQTASEGASTTTTGTERYETGIALRFTPQVSMETGEITMFLEPKISETRSSNIGNTSVRDPEDRGTKSVIRIKDGETIMIAGLLRTRYSAVTRKVPFLGDIPVLGWLFKHKNVSRDEDRELVIFLTPHIVKEGELSKIANREGTRFEDFSGNSLDREQLITYDRQGAIDTALKRWDR